jgi:hypothetical protein
LAEAFGGIGMIHHLRVAHGLAVAGKVILLAAVVKVALLLLLWPLWRSLFRRQPADASRS